METPINIPKNLYRFFWDVNPEKVNPKEKPYFVIQRLLDKGDVEAVKWTRHNFSNEQIAEVFLKLRDFNARIGRFWTLILDLPVKKVICLQEPYLTMRRQLWPY